MIIAGYRKEKLANPPDDCDCVNCTVADACKNSDGRWGDDGLHKEWRSIQGLCIYTHDKCRGFWQQPCD